MNKYKEYMKKIEDEQFLISMVPVEELLRFGYEIGLDENSRVLDLCCGYGTVLKVWSEAFGIYGVGVDCNKKFINVGEKRLKEAQITNVKLICEDVTKYVDNEKYDVVICSETFGDITGTMKLGEKFLKSSGIIAYQRLYSKVQNPPKELVDFDEGLMTLTQCNKIFNELGLYIVSMASDSVGKWEHYTINWCGKRDLKALRKRSDDEQMKQWIDKWYSMYFDYRRQYEGQVLFGLQRVLEENKEL